MMDKSYRFFYTQNIMDKSEEHRGVISYRGAARTSEVEVATTPLTTKVDPNTDRQHNEMLVHEHYLVPTTINEIKCFHCINCGTIYCQLCGKSIDASATQNPNEFEMYEREVINNQEFYV